MWSRYNIRPYASIFIQAFTCATLIAAARPCRGFPAIFLILAQPCQNNFSMEGTPLVGAI